MTVNSDDTRPSRRQRRRWSVLVAVAAAGWLVAAIAIVVIATGRGPGGDGGGAGGTRPAAAPVDDRVLAGHVDGVHAVATGLVDGKPVIVSGGQDGTVRVWDLATGAAIGPPIATNDYPVDVVAVAPLEQPTIVSSSADGTLRLWDLATREPRGRSGAGLTGSLASAFTTTRHGRAVLVGAQSGGGVDMWDLADRVSLGGLPSDGSSSLAVATASWDGHPVIVSASGSTLTMWDPDTLAPWRQAHLGSTVLAITSATEADGRAVVLTGDINGIVQKWDLAGLSRLGDPLTGAGSSVTSFATARVSGRLVVLAGYWDGAVRAWDATTGAAIGAPVTGTNGPVTDLTTAESEGRTVAVVADDDGRIYTWDLAYHLGV